VLLLQLLWGVTSVCDFGSGNRDSGMALAQIPFTKRNRNLNRQDAKVAKEFSFSIAQKFEFVRDICPDICSAVRKAVSSQPMASGCWPMAKGCWC
jgi:hypothetical protein